MSEGNAAAPTTEATPSVGTFEQRLAAVNEQLAAESGSQPAGEVTGAALSSPAAAPPSPADSDVEKRAAERRARLDALKDAERQKVDARAQREAIERMQRDYQAAMQRAEAAEKARQSMLDPGLLKDPARLVRMMGEAGIAPDAVANALRDAIQDPSVGATHAVREALTPEIAAVRRELMETQAALRAMHERYEAAQAAAEEARNTESFLGLVANSSERAPLAARLLAKNRNEFLQLATLAAESVPGMGAEALLDAVEDLIDTQVRPVAQTYGDLFSPTSPAPIQPTRAAAKAPTTVSNSAAQERASLLEDESLASLSLEERAARLIRSM